MTSQSELWQRKSTFRQKKRLDDATPIGADFSENIVIYKGAIRYGPWTDRQR